MDLHLDHHISSDYLENRTYGIEVFPGFSPGSHFGWLEQTVCLIFLGRFGDFSVFSQQSLQRHPQAEVGNACTQSRCLPHSVACESQ